MVKAEEQDRQHLIQKGIRSLASRRMYSPQWIPKGNYWSLMWTAPCSPVPIPSCLLPRALAKAAELGHHIVLATARPPRSVVEIADRLGIASTISIALNGAIIVTGNRFCGICPWDERHLQLPSKKPVGAIYMLI